MTVFSDVEYIIARPLPLITTDDAKRIFVCSEGESSAPLDAANPARFLTGRFSPVIPCCMTVSPSA